MRARCVIALFVSLFSWTGAGRSAVAGSSATVEQEFPYTAFVAVSQAAIRSGPGRNYYATEKLDGGETVEVYRHEGDWCGIRPTEKSFSWVKADDLQIGRDGVAIVLTDGAPCRVGSGVSGLRDVIQVRLQRGEQIEVLDAVQTSNDNGVEFFCKIAPPSGEFRWVHKDDISREDPRSEPGEGQVKHERTALARFEEQDDDSSAARSDRWGSWVRSRRKNAGGGASGDGKSARHEQGVAGDGSTITVAGEKRTSADNDRDHADRRERLPQAGAAEEVEAIDRELSRIVVAEPAQWNLDEVRARIDALASKTATDSVREALADLRERLARFDDIRARSRELAAGGGATSASAGTSSTSADVAPSIAASQPQTLAGADDSGRFDGVGRLARVVSKRPNAPRFALVDGANEVVSFVSPAPGVNLHSYEGQYVGITGQRGYMPELKKPHVTALRVTALSIAHRHSASRR